MQEWKPFVLSLGGMFYSWRHDRCIMMIFSACGHILNLNLCISERTKNIENNQIDGPQLSWSWTNALTVIFISLNWSVDIWPMYFFTELRLFFQFKQIPHTSSYLQTCTHHLLYYKHHTNAGYDEHPPFHLRTASMVRGVDSISYQSFPVLPYPKGEWGGPWSNLNSLSCS